MEKIFKLKAKLSNISYYEALVIDPRIAEDGKSISFTQIEEKDYNFQTKILRPNRYNLRLVIASDDISLSEVG